MPKKTTCEFTVEGSGAFPTDMLRYDAAHPKSESDSARIDDANRYDEGPIRACLISHVESTVRKGPTDARWQSFRWKVIEWRNY